MRINLNDGNIHSTSFIHNHPVFVHMFLVIKTHYMPNSMYTCGLIALGDDDDDDDGVDVGVAPNAEPFDNSVYPVFLRLTLHTHTLKHYTCIRVNYIH